MYFNPIIANLHNTKTNRFHPIIFVESPLPGPPSDDKPVRHKSKGHHTQGFDSRDAALSECRNIVDQIKEHAIGPPQLCIEKDFPWDGEDIPAMTVFFGTTESGVVPMLA